MVPTPIKKSKIGARTHTFHSRQVSILQRTNNVRLYTDDSILAGPDQKDIDQIIEDLKKAKLILTVEEDLQDFLGFNIEGQCEGAINLM